MPVELTHALNTPPGRDALARQDFVCSLRGYVLNDLAEAMKARYQHGVAPQLEKELGRAPANQDEVHRAMRPDPLFRFYSAIRVNAQEMVWRSVVPGLQPAPELERRIDRASGTAGGDLQLNPELKVPSNVCDVEVHLMPGGYVGTDSPAVGALYDQGLAVFSAGLMGRELDDIGMSMANYVRHRFPAFRPTVILDCGCSVGHNTVAWAKTYLEAEVYGIDVSAALLRYAHGRAESLGARVHFRQMDATKLEFPDESVDVVFSSMFLHELPLEDIRAFLAEARRVLRPGGLLLNMELPPNRQLDPYDQFYLDWDCYYNAEPFYRTYRDQDPAELAATAGFEPEAFFQFTVPQYTYMRESAFAEAVTTPPEIGGDTGRLSASVHWFGFGAWKS